MIERVSSNDCQAVGGLPPSAPQAINRAKSPMTSQASSNSIPPDNPSDWVGSALWTEVLKCARSHSRWEASMYSFRPNDCAIEGTTLVGRAEADTVRGSAPDSGTGDGHGNTQCSRGNSRSLRYGGVISSRRPRVGRSADASLAVPGGSCSSLHRCHLRSRSPRRGQELLCQPDGLPRDYL